MSEPAEASTKSVRKQSRAKLVRAVAADHGLGAGLTLHELIDIAVERGLKPESERAATIAERLAEPVAPE